MSILFINDIYAINLLYTYYTLYKFHISKFFCAFSFKINEDQVWINNYKIIKLSYKISCYIIISLRLICMNFSFFFSELLVVI